MSKPHFTFTPEQIEAACIQDDDRLVKLVSRGSRYLIHNTLRSNRESIQANGLIMHEPFKDGNWASRKDEFAMTAPLGIYAFPVGDEPKVTDPYVVGCQYGGDSATQIPGHEHEPMDHWLIDAQGLKTEEDPAFIGYALVIKENVSPDRLTLLTDLVDEKAAHKVDPLPTRKDDFGSIFDMLSLGDPKGYDGEYVPDYDRPSYDDDYVRDYDSDL